MSRDPYAASGGGNRSPRSTRRVGELPTVDRSPSRNYPAQHGPAGSRGSPLGRKTGGRPTRSGNTSPDHVGGGYSSSYGQPHSQSHQPMGSPYYRDDDLGSPIMMDDRGRSVGVSGSHHRSRSASRPAIGGSNPMSTRYQSLDRAGGAMGDSVGHEREFMPIREPRERSLDRVGARERSLERGLYLEDELYGGGSRSARQSPNPHMMGSGRDAGGVYIGELQNQNNDLQRELGNFKKELELTNQKLGSSMHSIKTFWSPELKKERALRKEESAKYSLINDQLKLLNSENQKQAMLVRQLEEELRLRMRNPSMEMQQQMEVLFSENEHLTREISILRETIKELELRIETQKQTLQARDESIKKLLEMLQNKGVGGKMLDHEEKLEFATLQAKLIESENKMQHYESLVRNRDQELSMTKRELKATNETLRALQIQLEKQLHSQNSGGPTNSTLTAILETKDARIVTLEKEVALLENELDRIRECGGAGPMQGRDMSHIRISSPIPDMMDHSLSRNEYSYKRQLDEFRGEIQRRDQEIMAMSAKMKTLEEQHQDYQRHIAVLKESLCAKEEHYNMLQADVEELRQRLDEKNRHIEKKTMTASQATQERNRLNSELNELRDHMDIKDRKINVLQRKLDLHDANTRLKNGTARAGEETSSLKMQLDEQKKQLEDQRRKLDEHKKGLDTKSRQLEEKQKSIADTEQKMKQRKEKMDQLEAQIQKSAAAGGRGGGDTVELQKRLAETERAMEAMYKDLEKSKEDAQRSQVEMERLLQLVQMSQEEQNSKEKMIRDLQDALKNAQAKLRSQQTANAQMPKPQENEAKDASEGETIRELREEVRDKVCRVSQLEQDVRELEDVLIDHGKVGEVQSLKEVAENKGKKIAELEKVIKELENALKNQEHGGDLSNTLKIKSDEMDNLRDEVEKKNLKVTELEKVVDDLVAALKENETFNCSLLDEQENEELNCLREEVEKKGLRICELELEVDELETALKDHNNIAELEELVGLVRLKDDRIEELSEALRQSVRITADRENVLHQEEQRRKQIMEKVGKLEQRLLSLQTAHALRCSTCRPLLNRMQELERRLTQLLTERRQHLQDLSNMKQEALESAISEKDAHLAMLEVSGIRTARQSEEVDQLKADRRRLMDRLKEENERSVRLLQEYSDPVSLTAPAALVLDEDVGDCNNRNLNGRHNCMSLNNSGIDPDSLEDTGLNMTI